MAFSFLFFLLDVLLLSDLPDLHQCILVTEKTKSAMCLPNVRHVRRVVAHRLGSSS